MRDIEFLAGVITEDPNLTLDHEEVLQEWFWQGLEQYFTDPQEKALAELLDKAEVKRLVAHLRLTWPQAARQAMDDLRMELDAFQRHYPMLAPEEALETFVYVRKYKKWPAHLRRDPRELDQIGGADFRSAQPRRNRFS